MRFVYRIFTFSDLPFQKVLLRNQFFTLIVVGSSPFNRLYLGNRYYFLFLWVLRCFNSPGLPPIAIYSL